MTVLTVLTVVTVVTRDSVICSYATGSAEEDWEYGRQETVVKYSTAVTVVKYPTVHSGFGPFDWPI